MRSISITLSILFFSFWMVSNAQNEEEVKNCLRKGRLPQVELSSERANYMMSSTYSGIGIDGSCYDQFTISGAYSQHGASGQVSWEEVVKRQEFPENSVQSIDTFNYMNGFTYKPTEETTSPGFFEGFPPDDMYSRNLVWDMQGIEAFAWFAFDSLQLNVPYVFEVANQDIELSGLGTFTNSNIQLTWMGVGTQNGESCALIHFIAMGNPFSADFEGSSMKGLSNYWGHVWVSLSDKQIEHAVLIEDVTMEMKQAEETDIVRSMVHRKIVLEKIN